MDQERNPYRGPVAKVAETMPDERLRIDPASRWRRFFNWLIDYACFTLLSMLVLLPYAAWLYARGGVRQ
jgi:uncharacterized RDD family membrane protein YckC